MRTRSAARREEEIGNEPIKQSITKKEVEVLSKPKPPRRITKAKSNIANVPIAQSCDDAMLKEEIQVDQPTSSATENQNEIKEEPKTKRVPKRKMESDSQNEQIIKSKTIKTTPIIELIPWDSVVKYLAPLDIYRLSIVCKLFVSFARDFMKKHPKKTLWYYIWERKRQCCICNKQCTTGNKAFQTFAHFECILRKLTRCTEISFFNSFDRQAFIKLTKIPMAKTHHKSGFKIYDAYEMREEESKSIPPWCTVDGCRRIYAKQIAEIAEARIKRKENTEVKRASGLETRTAKLFEYVGKSNEIMELLNRHQKLFCDDFLERKVTPKRSFKKLKEEFLNFGIDDPTNIELYKAYLQNVEARKAEKEKKRLELVKQRMESSYQETCPCDGIRLVSASCDYQLCGYCCPKKGCHRHGYL